VIPLHLLVAALVGWLEGEQHKVIEYLREENRVLKAHLQNQRPRLTDDDRRRLAVLGAALGRRLLAQVATIVTADTILRWHRQLIARKWTYPKRRPGRPHTLPEIRRLVVRMASENPSWGYMRIQGALKNLGHRVARSTIATILKQQGIPPSGERPTSWQTFLRAHWGALVAADFFTTEVWTVRGLVTYYTVFVIELQSRRVSIVGSTPHPDEAFMLQIVRQLTDAGDGALSGRRFLICDRDRKWSTAVRQLLETSGVRVIQTPFRAPNCNAHAERFVRSVKQKCLNRLIPLGERHLRGALAESSRTQPSGPWQRIDRWERRPSTQRAGSPAPARGWASQLLLSCGVARCGGREFGRPSLRTLRAAHPADRARARKTDRPHRRRESGNSIQ
jgi:putative transposase